MKSLVHLLILPILFTIVLSEVLSAQPSALTTAEDGGLEVETADSVQIEAATPTPRPTPSEEVLDSFLVQNIPAKLSGRLAFTATVDRIERIFVLDLDARVIRSIVYGPGNNSYPTWSPDGSQITFESDRDGNKEIYVADWDGARQRRITNSLGADADPTWNPSGDEVFFYRQESGEQANIYAYSLSSNSERQITSFSGRNTTPRISPNGRFLSYSTNRFWPGWDVCFWDLENHHENCVLKGSESYCRAAWSQSGNFLTYSGGNPGHYNIELFNLRLGSKTRLTALAGREYDPVWSPDDSHIAFVAEGQRDRNLFSLYVQGVTEEKVHQVLKTPYSIRYLSWSPAKTIDLESARIKASQEEESVASDQGYRPPYLRDESDKLDTQTPQPSPVLNEE